jgi:methionyl-tRNA formyltransferase
MGLGIVWLQASPVKQFALQHGLPLAQPRSLKLDGRFAADALAGRDAILAARDAGAVALVVAAYGLILPQWVLDVFSPAQCAGGLGCWNIHASLLPRWRGAAPIHRAIEAGDAQTGITIMQMNAGLDTGDMLLVGRTPISATDTTGELHDRLAAQGGELIAQALRRSPQPRDGQPGAEHITYAAKIDKAESAIRWGDSAAQIARRVRAFHPAPGASAVLRGEVVKVWMATALDESVAADAPGTVLRADARGVDVACGQGVLRLQTLQRAGGKRLPLADFLRGFAVQAGEHFADNSAQA